MAKFGADISRYDRDISIPRLRDDGVEFVIVKCGGGDDGLYADSWFERNYQKCIDNKMPVGAYWYSAAHDVETAKREADYCVRLLNGRHLDYPVWMDVEDRTHQLMCTNQPGLLGRIIDAFCSRIVEAGYRTGIYSWKWLLDPCGSAIAPYDRWVCAWTRSKPSGQVDLWQFGGEENVIRSTALAGHDPVDQDYAYTDYISMGGWPKKSVGEANTDNLMISVEGKNTVVWFSNGTIHDLSHPDDMNVLGMVARACGCDLRLLTVTPDEYARLCQSTKAGLPKHLEEYNNKFKPRS